MFQRRPKIRYKIVPPPKEKLENLYYNEDLKYSELAKIFNVSSFLIGQWMRLYNIKAKKPKGCIKFNFSNEEIVHMYLVEKKSIHVISRELGCSHTLIQKRLHASNVKLRSRSEAISLYIQKK